MGAGASSARTDGGVPTAECVDGEEEAATVVDESWVLEAAEQFLGSSAWQQRVAKFVDSGSEEFSAEEEFTHEQFSLWRSFQSLVQEQLSEYLQSVGVPPQALVALLRSAVQDEDPATLAPRQVDGLELSSAERSALLLERRSPAVEDLLRKVSSTPRRR